MSEEELTGRQLAARDKIRGMKLPPELLDPLVRVAAGNSFEIGHRWDVPLKELEILQLIVEQRYTDHRYSRWALLDAGQAMLDRVLGRYSEPKESRTIVLDTEEEDDPAGDYAERTIAILEPNGGMTISHQFFSPDSKKWQNWVDAGAVVGPEGVKILKAALNE